MTASVSAIISPPEELAKCYLSGSLHLIALITGVEVPAVPHLGNVFFNLSLASSLTEKPLISANQYVTGSHIHWRGTDQDNCNPHYFFFFFIAIPP